MKGLQGPGRAAAAGWNSKTWIDLSGIPTASGNSENNIEGIMQPGVSAIGIRRIKSAFPFRVACSAPLQRLQYHTPVKVIPVKALAGRIIDEQSNDGKISRSCRLS